MNVVGNYLLVCMVCNHRPNVCSHRPSICNDRPKFPMCSFVFSL